jgi:hypothetical protein
MAEPDRMGAATMRHTVKANPDSPTRRGLWQRSPISRAFCEGCSNFLDMSENPFHTSLRGRLMAGWVAAGTLGCQHNRLPGEKAPHWLRPGRRALTLEAVQCFDWQLFDHTCLQMSTGSASLRRELAIKKTRACLLRSSRLGEKTFTRHTLCTLRLHLSCLGERSITLNNGAADANGR